MKHFKTIHVLALIAIVAQQSTTFSREKRSFSWPSFLGGSGSANEEVSDPTPAQDVQVAPQQQVELPVHELSSGYHYPIWRVHKYNGIELKPISLVPQHIVQTLQRTQLSPMHKNIQVPPTHFQQSGNVSPQLPNQPLPNCISKAASSPIPAELQDLADQFGIKDASKLPSLEEAMGLLGTTTREETIQTIKELAETKEGMDLVRQFLASEESNSNSQCVEMTEPQESIKLQPSNANANQLPFVFPVSVFPMSHQQYSVPGYPHENYGLPNAHQTAEFHGAGNANPADYTPKSNIMSLVKSDAIPSQQQYNVPYDTTYGVPNELSEAYPGYQEYNTPKPNIELSGQTSQHEVYGLPNVQRSAAFQNNVVVPQGYYPSSTNVIESVTSESIAPHREYNLPNEESISVHERQVPHDTYGIPSELSESDFAEHNAPIVNSQTQLNGITSQHESYGLPNIHRATAFQEGYYAPSTNITESVQSEAIDPHLEYNLPNEASKSGHETQISHNMYGTPGDIPSTEENQASVKSENPQKVYLPSQQTYGVPNQEIDLASSDSIKQNESLQPHSSTNTQQINFNHEHVALPHQRFFSQFSNEQNSQSQQTSRSNHRQSKYGAPAQSRINVPVQIPVLRQIDNALDRTLSDLELTKLLTTTVRPEAGFLERISSWTNLFTPPAPAVPIVPPLIEENGNTLKAYSIPIRKIPEDKKQHLTGFKSTPQLPNFRKPHKFAANRNQYTLYDFNTPLTGTGNDDKHLLRPVIPKRLDREDQDEAEFAPDISQLPLGKESFYSGPRTSYGTPTHPASDSSPAASEQDEKHVAVLLPLSSGKDGKRFDNEISDDKPKTNFGPQRISSYDSYASGKLNRADENAIINSIPTQKPAFHLNQGRTINQLEDSSVIDAIATMTSGFHPIANSNL